MNRARGEAGPDDGDQDEDEDAEANRLPESNEAGVLMDHD
jgi:hypothetical protein